MSVRKAAETYGVPKSTLGDRVSGKVDLDAKPGPTSYLTTFEEEELASFLIRCAKIGYPRNRSQQIVNSKGLDASVFNGWWERFCQRQPNLSLRVPMGLTCSRAVASDRDVIDKYYSTLEDTLIANKLLHSPGSIFNCDETGVPLSPRSLKVVAEKGQRIQVIL